MKAGKEGLWWRVKGSIIPYLCSKEAKGTTTMLRAQESANRRESVTKERMEAKKCKLNKEYKQKKRVQTKESVQIEERMASKIRVQTEESAVSAN